ncbi:glycoside hydrolase family 3 protein [Mycetocola saprophilus]|uniref:glycoside hydrolase family 3 protein n=1 Tax=Mycetocola saprophilus TaxID=76636 RepID=UPI0004C16833|nr:glycoside hydrolase family 3 N-terminal domain-containing protein [Mycetocola saprophilus]
MTNSSLSAEVLRAISATMLPGFDGPELPDWLAARLRAGLGGVCLFSMNIESPSQLRELTAAILDANPDAVIAIDEEGGDVTRLHHQTGSPFPGNAILGKLGDPVGTEGIAARVGYELADAGATMTFAPDADINSNPNNPVIGTRSFGTDAHAVGVHTAAWVRGVQGRGIDASTKHFPGHGDTENDSHLSLPVIDRSLEELRERELIPFVDAIAAGTNTIMTSHIMLPQVDPEHPATLSRTILQDLLRGELGFTGVIVTDALDMTGASGKTGIPEAAVRALAAGCDLLCIGSNNTDPQMGEIEAHVAAAIESGVLPAERVLEAAERLRVLADRGRTLRAEAASQPIPDTAWPTPAAVAATFDVLPGVSLPTPSPEAPVHVVTVEGVPNIAVGPLPWGPHAAQTAEARDAGLIFHLVDGTDLSGAVAEIPTGVPIVVLGQNNHRGERVQAVLALLRERGDAPTTVDMGWPAPDRADAQIATLGASRLAGEAFLERWLSGGFAAEEVPR